MKKFIKNLLILVVILLGIYSLFQATTAVNNNYSSSKEPDGVLVLVNRGHHLSSNYVPKNLIVPSVKFIPNASKEEKTMQKEAAEALEKLFTFAKKNGINLYGVSGYRSYDSQKKVYDERVKNVGKKQANKYVAYPGNSEHQTGLAIDVTNELGFKGKLMVDLGETEEGKWLKSYAQKFGFIMRYPKEKEDITGYNYESWHIRYVGINAAKEIYRNNMVLEEYLKEN